MESCSSGCVSVFVTWVVRGELQFWVCFSVCDVGSERRAAGCVSVFVTWVVRGELQFWVCFSVCDVGSERRAAVQGVFQCL